MGLNEIGIEPRNFVVSAQDRDYCGARFTVYFFLGVPLDYKACFDVITSIKSMESMECIY